MNELNQSELEKPNASVKWAAETAVPSETVVHAAPLERLVGLDSEKTGQEGILKRRSFVAALTTGIIGLFSSRSKAATQNQPTPKFDDSLLPRHIKLIDEAVSKGFKSGWNDSSYYLVPSHTYFGCETSMLYSWFHGKDFYESRIRIQRILESYGLKSVRIRETGPIGLEYNYHFFVAAVFYLRGQAI